MGSDDNQGERELRERIASRIRANGQARKKQITKEELQKLKSAKSRLERMLKAAADADRQALVSAAGRLDQMLSKIRTGKT